MPRFLLVILCAACFGTGLSVSRMGLAEFSVSAYTALRFAVALLAFGVLAAVRRSDPWPRDRRFWMLAALFGLTGTALPTLLIIGSLQYLSSGMAAIVAAVGPALAVILAHFFLGDERISARKLLGISIAFVGAASLVVQRESGLADSATPDLLGYLMLGGGLALSYGSIIMARRQLRTYPIVQVVSVQVGTATLVVLPLAWSDLSTMQVSHIGTALFTVVYGGLVGTFAAFLTRFQLIKQHGATDAALIDYVVPVMAIVAGIVLLDEVFTLPMAVGMAVILAGVRLVQSQPAPNLPNTAAKPK